MEERLEHQNAALMRRVACSPAATWRFPNGPSVRELLLEWAASDVITRCRQHSLSALPKCIRDIARVGQPVYIVSAAHSIPPREEADVLDDARSCLRHHGGYAGAFERGGLAVTFIRHPDLDELRAACCGRWTIKRTPSKEEALDWLRAMSGLSDWEGEEDDAIIAYEALRRRVRHVPLSSHGLFAELIAKTPTVFEQLSVKDLFRVTPMGKAQYFDTDSRTWVPCKMRYFNLKLRTVVADALQDLLRTYDYDGDEFHPSPTRGNLTNSGFISSVAHALKASLIVLM
jgi:hypothetical protein